MNKVKNIIRSLLVVAPAFIIIVLFDYFSDALNILQGEWAPLMYIIPVMAVLTFIIYHKTR